MTGKTTEEPSDELLDFLWQQRSNHLYRAWVQVRYHQKRRRFFDIANKGTTALTVLLGASLFGKHVEPSLPVVATLISALGFLALIFGYDERKYHHKELAEQAAQLVADIEKHPNFTADLNAEFASKYAAYCAKLPPPLEVLTILCEREQSIQDGFPENVKKPNFLRCWLAHFVS